MRVERQAAFERLIHTMAGGPAYDRPFAGIIGP
jgi:hypothetical protein